MNISDEELTMLGLTREQYTNLDYSGLTKQQWENFEWDSLTKDQKHMFVRASAEKSHKRRYDDVRALGNRADLPTWEDLTPEQRTNIRAENQRYRQEMEAFGAELRRHSE